MTTLRAVQQLVPALDTSDGAGVRLRRSLGQKQTLRLDPFLMLDEFGSEKPDEYIAGFPPHPHRGFETVTYMLEGHMLHEDHMGNRGNLHSGDVQWMTAARGIIHSEMPQQERGLMRGFQLWINLPASEKMNPASYRDIPAASIPILLGAHGTSIKVIAGEAALEGQQATGPIHGLTTQPLYLDIQLPKDQALTHPIPATHNAFLYLYEGALTLGGTAVPAHTAVILGPGDAVEVRATDNARCLLLAGRPINEPVVQYGPFVMNTREEIERAIADYQQGRLAT